MNISYSILILIYFFMVFVIWLQRKDVEKNNKIPFKFYFKTGIVVTLISGLLIYYSQIPEAKIPSPANEKVLIGPPDF